MTLTLVLDDGGQVEAHLFDSSVGLALAGKLRAEGLRVVVIRNGRVIQGETPARTFEGADEETRRIPRPSA